MPGPYDLRLVVDRQVDFFQARWIEPDGQESAPFPLDLPLSEEDAEALRWYLEDSPACAAADDRARARELEAHIETWGRKLYESLFHEAEGARVHLRLMEAASSGRPAFFTLGTDDPEIHVQPWEMLRDYRGPLVFQGVTIRRQLRGAGAARRLHLRLPLKVLRIVSRPRTAGSLEVRNSAAPMLDALDLLPPGEAVVDSCEPPTLSRLEELISEARKKRSPFHIVHFDGHGMFLPETGVGTLAFERDAPGAEPHLVDGRQLGDLLARLDVPLVFLEACRSSALSKRSVFGSVAPALLRSGVGSVIALSHAVRIEAAQLLVERFYKELTDGLTVGQALEEARVRLRAKPERRRRAACASEDGTVDLQDWFIPQLYQVGPDPALVFPDKNRTGESAPSSQPQAGTLPASASPTMDRLSRNAMEVLRLEPAFHRPSTYLELSVARADSVLEKLTALYDLDRALEPDERAVLGPAQYLVALRQESGDPARRLEARSLGGKVAESFCHAVRLAADGARPEADLDDPRFRSGPLRCDLLAGFLRLGHLLAADHSAVVATARGRPPASFELQDWLAYLTPQIRLVRGGLVVFVLQVPQPHLVDPLKRCTAWKLEALWQSQLRGVLGRYLVPLQVCPTEVTVSSHVASLPPDVARCLEEAARKVPSSVSIFRHLGDGPRSKLPQVPRLEELLPLPGSALSEPLTLEVDDEPWVLTVQDQEDSGTTWESSSRETSAPVLDPAVLRPGRHFRWNLWVDEGLGDELSLLDWGTLRTLSEEEEARLGKIVAEQGSREHRMARISARLSSDLFRELAERIGCLEASSEETALALSILQSSLEWFSRHQPNSGRVELCRNMAEWIYICHQQQRGE